MVRLLHNGLRVDEACAADVANLGTDTGHRVLRVVRKARIPLTPATVAALDATLLTGPAAAGSATRGSGGPLLATAPAAAASAKGTCGNWCAAWPATPASRPGTSSPRTACGTRRSPSPSFNAGAILRDVQDYAWTRTPHHPPVRPARDSLDRNAAYAVAAYLA